MKIPLVKVLLITLVFAIPAFILGKIIWPPSTAMGMPTPALLPFFIVMSAIESLAFGLGMSFLILGLPLAQKFPKNKRNKMTLMILSIGWLLVNWWPHDNLHASIGMDLKKLLYLEYGFHATLIIAGLIVAYNFYNFLRNPKK